MTKKLKISIHKRLPKKKNKRHRSKDKRNITNKSEKNLEVHSLKSINNEYKKNFENKNKLSNKSKSHGKNILTVKKKSFVQIELDPFFERLERFKTKKQQHINNLKSKLSEKENTEILKRPKILKNSLIILEKKYDRNKKRRFKRNI